MSLSLKDLPYEVAISILLLCDTKTLSAASRVSRSWFALASDLFLWRKIYLAKGYKWNQPLANWWSNTPLLETGHVTTSEERKKRYIATGHLVPEQGDSRWTTHDSLWSTITAVMTTSANRSELQRPPPPHVSELHATDNGVPERLHPRSTWPNSHPPLPSSAGHFQTDRSFLYASLEKNHVTAQGERFINWKYLCGQRTRLDENWEKGRCRVRRLEGHSKAVYTIQFDETKIVSGSRDDTIKIWNTKMGQCHRTLRGHHGSVLSLQYDDREIISGSSDSSVRVWDLSTGRTLRILEGHGESVLCVRFDEQRIVSCSIDRSIKVWSRGKGNGEEAGGGNSHETASSISESSTPPCLLTLQGHRAAVNAVQFHEDLVVSASGDRTIRLWSLTTGTCHRVLEGHTRGIACLHYSPATQTLLTGSSDHSIRLWDIRSGTECADFDGLGHTRLVRSVYYDDGNKFVSGSYDKTVKVWDIRMGRMVTDLKDGHTSNVFKVMFNESKIVSCGHDRTIVIWDFAKDVDTTFLV